jgi:hypothetical protein
MIDDDSSVDPKAVADDGEHFDEALLYDFAKFLTTLALLMLGGVLTITQTADKAIAKPPIVALVVLYIALAGTCAITAAGKIAKLQVGKGRKWVTTRQLLLGSIFFLGMGAGGFLTLWWKTL